ncbi:hypothetical protein [Aeoliella sp. SH292]|jgi:hypothetical protein|uniref:hypothetical protein n=1 Tax=Aeoliella sp. SH292 TaxID=3454464 RepID=UPI003F94506C
MTPVVLAGIITASATAAVLLATCVSAAFENPPNATSRPQPPLSEVLSRGN